MIKLGSSDIRMRYGGQLIGKAYLGDTLVFEDDEDFNLPPVPDTGDDVYFATHGSDIVGDGTIDNPLRTVAMASRVVDDGKSLFFQGGATFEGVLEVSGKEDVTITSYGSGRARLGGIRGENTPGIQVLNIHAHGGSQLVNPNAGIHLINSHSGATQIPGVRVEGCLVEEFGSNGIFLEAINFPSGFDAPEVWSNEVRFCTGMNLLGHTAGIVIAAEAYWGLATFPPSNFDVDVDNNHVHDCDGASGAANHTGSGIIVAQADGVEIVNSVVHDCGSGSTNQAGPVAVWFWDTINGRIAHNHVERMQSGRSDGGAYDIDGGCQDCVIEYNYSRDCIGPGVLLFSFDDSAFTPTHQLLDYENNTARFNISVNDGASARSRYGAFLGSMRRNTVTDFQNIRFYNNTIVVGNLNPVVVGVNTFESVDLSHATGLIANNLFITNSPLPESLLIDTRHTEIEIVGNAYFSVVDSALRYFGFDSGPNIAPPLDSYVHYSSISRDTGHIKEFWAGSQVMFIGDPRVVDRTSYTPGDLRPLATSLSIGVGFDLEAEFGIPLATEDFLGNSIPQAHRRLFPCGALEPVAYPVTTTTAPNNPSNAAWIKQGLTVKTPAVQGVDSANQGFQVHVNNGEFDSYLTQDQDVPTTPQLFRTIVYCKADGLSSIILGRAPERWEGWPIDTNGRALYWFDLEEGELEFQASTVSGVYSFQYPGEPSELNTFVPGFRIQKRPNGFYMVMIQVIAPAGTDDNVLWITPSARFPNFGSPSAASGNTGIIIDRIEEFVYDL